VNFKEVKAMLKTSGKRNLIICRAGESSLHPAWLNPPAYKNFDLWVNYYGATPGKYARTCDLYRESKGIKYPEIHRFIIENIDRVIEYDAVWLPDDDLRCDARTIHEMFELFHHYELRLAQPSLSQDSNYSHEITLHHPECILRYTNFIEPMAPIFSRVALQICLPTFTQCQSGWGLDYVWPKLLSNAPDKVAIIDAVTVVHTRPVGNGDLYKKLPEHPMEELYRLGRQYGFTPFEMITFKSIPK
jgi:hypothetical protein